jgi:hypothetical protein
MRPRRSRNGFCRRKRQPAMSLVHAVCISLWLVAAASPALADAAAGRKAFDEGNYEKAMAEWQRAADRGDAEGQFGLGSLYEQGLGGLTQDYKKAEYWYANAAQQGNTEAQYRLALIWAAGGDNLAPDLIEAYKWAVIAAKSIGVWGPAGTDVEGQLDKVLSASERASGKERATKWTEALVSKKEQPAASPAPPANPAPVVAVDPSHAAKAPATGCPGWPFPTLPCTEQFPSLGHSPR